MSVTVTETSAALADVPQADLDELAAALTSLLEEEEEALPLCGTRNCGTC